MVGASMTVTSHAVLLHDAMSIYLILFSMITCQEVHKLSMVGLVLFIIGIYIMIMDPYAIKKDANEPSLLGDIIAFIGAGAGAVNIKVSSMMPKYMFPTTRI